MLIFETWTLDIEPLRKETYKRLYRFSDHCRELGIPNPYSLNEYMKAEERWKKLHKNAVPSMLDFLSRNTYIDENKDIKRSFAAKNKREPVGDFDF